MLAIAVTDMFFSSTYDIGKKLIRKGKFDTILLRPVHPLISVLGDSYASTAIGYIILALVIIVSMIIKLHITVTIALILKIIFLGIIGGIIIGGIETIASISGFWTYKSNEVVWSLFRMYRLAQYPIEIYNKFIRIIITIILPFAFVAYYPTLEYINGNSNTMLIIGPIIAVIVWIIAIKVWNWGLKKYRSTGT